MKYAWLLAVLYAVVLLAFVCPQRSVGSYGMETDFYAFYGPQARAALSGHVFLDEYHGPLFGWAIAGVCLLTRQDPFRSAMTVDAVSAGVLLLLCYLLGCVTFDRTTAWWAMLLVATSPLFFRCSYNANIHMPFAALCLLAAWALLRDRWLFAALAIVACCWMRWNSFALLLPVVLSRHRLRIWSVCALGIAVLAWWSWRYYGGVFHSLNGENLAWGLYGDRTVALFHDPMQIAVSSVRNFFVYGVRVLVYGLALPIGVLALGSVRKVRLDPHTLMLAVSFAVLCLIYWGDHYAVLFLPYIAMLSANTVLQWRAKLS